MYNVKYSRKCEKSTWIFTKWTWFFFENPIKLVQLFRNQLFIIITDSNSFFVNKYLRIQYEKEIIWPIFYKFDHLSVCCMIILDNTIQSWLIPNKFFKIITDSNFIVYIFYVLHTLKSYFGRYSQISMDNFHFVELSWILDWFFLGVRVLIFYMKCFWL